MEPVYKPVPKPHSKAVDKPVQSDKTHRETVLELSQTAEKTRIPSEDLSSDPRSMSPHEKVQCASGESSLYETHSIDTNSHPRGDSEDGNFNSDPPPVRSAALVPQH